MKTVSDCLRHYGINLIETLLVEFSLNKRHFKHDMLRLVFQMN